MSITLRLTLSAMLAVFCITVQAKEYAPSGNSAHIMVLSLSSDAKYAISSNLNRHAVLWNLQKHTYKVLPTYPVNIYSAYFIKGTYDFLIQNDKTNQVLVENVSGKIVKTLNPGFPTYGEVMTSNLQNYFASKQNYNIYKIDNQGNKTQLLYFYCGPNFHKPAPPKGMPHACMGFIGGGKLMNLSFTADDKVLKGSGNGDVYLWNVSTGKLLHHLAKNEGQTFATISPDGQSVISGDVGGNIYVFAMNSGKYLKSIEEFDYLVVSLKFITPNELMAVYYGGPPSVTIYSYPSGKKIKSLPLLTPHQQQQVNQLDYYSAAPNYPEVQSYLRDQAIDTSPSAHVLVMAMSQKNGILVYHYDPKTQTLKQIWAPVVKQKPWWYVW